MADPVPQTAAESVQFFFREDAPITADVATFEACCAQSNAAAVRIEPGDDARALVPFLDRLALIEINFPSFADGRGYSAARILREAGYEGELRAVGDVLIDQLSHMRRCGFDAFAPAKPLNEEDAKRAFERWDNVYQHARDNRKTIAELRHE